MKNITDKINNIIDAIEKKTKIGVRTFLKQWSWLFFGKIVGSVTALLLASGYANFLSQETYGTYKYVLSIFAFLSVFSLLGMEDASQRSVAKGKEGAFWTTFKKRLQWSMLATLGSACIGIYYLVNDNFLLGTIFLAASPFLILLNTLSHYNSLLMGRQLFKQISYRNIFIQVISAIVIFITVTIVDDVFILILVYLITFVSLRGLTFLYTTYKFPPNNVPDSDSLRYGAHMSFVGIASIATNQISPLLLWHFLGPVQLAIYAFALAVVVQLRGIFKLATTTMAFPRFSKTDKNIIKETLPKKVLIAHLITIPLAVFLAFLIPYVYKFLFPTYIDSIPYAQALTLLFAFAPLRLFSTALLANGSPKAIHTFSIFSSVLLLLALLVAIPIFGIWGIVYANIIQQVFVTILVIYLFKKM